MGHSSRDVNTRCDASRHWGKSAALSFEKHMHLAETRPPFLVPLPALAHQVIEFAGAQGRSFEALSFTADDGGGGVRRRATADSERSGSSSGVVVGSTSVELFTVVDDLFVGEIGERSVTGEGQDFPQRHAEGPDITLRRKTTLDTQEKNKTMVTFYVFPHF